MELLSGIGKVLATGVGFGLRVLFETLIILSKPVIATLEVLFSILDKILGVIKAVKSAFAPIGTFVFGGGDGGGGGPPPPDFSGGGGGGSPPTLSVEPAPSFRITPGEGAGGPRTFESHIVFQGPVSVRSDDDIESIRRVVREENAKFAEEMSNS